MFNVTSLHYLGVDTDAQVSPARGTLQVDQPLLRSAGVTAVTPIVRTNPNDRRQRGLSRPGGAHSGRCARFCPGAGRAPSLPTLRLRLPRPHPAPHSPALSPKDRTPGSGPKVAAPRGRPEPLPLATLFRGRRATGASRPARFCPAGGPARCGKRSQLRGCRPAPPRRLFWAVRSRLAGCCLSLCFPLSRLVSVITGRLSRSRGPREVPVHWLLSLPP